MSVRPNNHVEVGYSNTEAVGLARKGELTCILSMQPHLAELVPQDVELLSIEGSAACTGIHTSEAGCESESHTLTRVYVSLLGHTRGMLSNRSSALGPARVSSVREPPTVPLYWPHLVDMTLSSSPSPSMPAASL